MVNSGYRAPEVGGLPAVKTGECPCVADLIDYAQGRLRADDRRRIETHLNSGACGHCRSWIAKASSADPPGANLVSQTTVPASPRPSANERSAWQRLAFRDLEERLRQLEGDV